MRKFFRKNQTFVIMLVAIVMAMVVGFGQYHQGKKNEAITLQQGDVLTIPEVTIK